MAIDAQMGNACSEVYMRTPIRVYVLSPVQQIYELFFSFVRLTVAISMRVIDPRAPKLRVQNRIRPRAPLSPGPFWAVHCDQVIFFCPPGVRVAWSHLRYIFPTLLVPRINVSFSCISPAPDLFPFFFLLLTFTV